MYVTEVTLKPHIQITHKTDTIFSCISGVTFAFILIIFPKYIKHCFSTHISHNKYKIIKGIEHHGFTQCTMYIMCSDNIAIGLFVIMKIGWKHVYLPT